ncbi:hypothetical protein H7U20_21135, partial [Rugamonas sp. CCM 8940]|nr:hypothetical protein [Rugamonas sp. CCM 8940]
MITMEMLGKVRRMHLRDKLSLHEISKRTGLSRNTLRKWLRKSDAEVVAPPRYQRDDSPHKSVVVNKVVASLHAASFTNSGSARSGLSQTSS